MTSPSQQSGDSHHPIGRYLQPQYRGMLLIYGIAITFSLVISGILLIKQVYPGAAPDIRVASHAPPPGAEPFGRAWGPQDAPIKVVAYTDYACESCASFAANVEHELITTYAGTGKVRFEIRFAPFHGEGAKRAAQAAGCAADQNRFWPMHSSLFLNQPPFNASASADFTVERLTTLAERLKLDVPVFSQCLTADTYSQHSEAALKDAAQHNVTSTPTFVVNETSYTDPVSADQFASIFREVAPDVTFD